MHTASQRQNQYRSGKLDEYQLAIYSYKYLARILGSLMIRSVN